MRIGNGEPVNVTMLTTMDLIPTKWRDSTAHGRMRAPP